MSPFSSLPQGCIANIISFTSPRYACTAAVVSLGFKSAADSDAVWEHFLPSDYQQMISSSDPSLIHLTKKHLYFLLCDSGLLLDRGDLNMRLSRSSGKKCYMVSARQLHITWKETPKFWVSASLPESRFSEVAELLAVCWLYIEVTLSSQLLSPNTNYAAYLVFKLSVLNCGLDCPSKVSVDCVGKSTSKSEGSNVRTVHIVQPTRNDDVQRRADGWMEIELGEFFVGREDRFDVVCKFYETEKLLWKRGLIVEGIEVRPKGVAF